MFSRRSKANEPNDPGSKSHMDTPNESVTRRPISAGCASKMMRKSSGEFPSGQPNCDPGRSVGDKVGVTGARVESGCDGARVGPAVGAVIVGVKWKCEWAVEWETQRAILKE